MPITIDVDGTEETMARIKAMLTQLAELRHYKIANEFADWQTEDVHRQRPFVVRHRGPSWSTRFRPHSKWEMTRHRRAVRRAIRHGWTPSGPRSTRPILRAELIDALVRRMEELLDTITW
jgi:hypothetical protein